MSLFSIETFYFLTMGIVGILIVILIFHFRNKIVLLEKQVQGLHSIASELVDDVRRSQSLSYGLGAGLDNNFPRQPVRFAEHEEENDVPPLVIGSTVEPEERGAILDETILEEAVPLVPESLQEVGLPEAVSLVPEAVSLVPEAVSLVPEAVSLVPEAVQESLQEVEEDDDKTVATVEGASLPLKKRHVSELRSLALSAGIEGAAKMKKAELVALLSTGHQEPVPDTTGEVLV